MRKTIYNLSVWKVIIFFFLFFLSFQTLCFAADITLRWDANTEPDLAGYKLYYNTDYSGPPYEGTGADQGTSPVDLPLSNFSDPNNPEFTITGLDDDYIYFLVLTAYDTEENESGYSNEVSTVTGGSSGGDDDSADGGGCFIATTTFGSRTERHVQILCEFRDKHLLTNSIGRKIVDFYYKNSPPIADYLHRHPGPRKVAGYALIPVTILAYLMLFDRTLLLLLFITFMLITVMYIARCIFIRLEPIDRNADEKFFRLRGCL